MKKFILYIISVCVCLLFGCVSIVAQKKDVKLHAYYTVEYPGIVQRDAFGNEITPEPSYRYWLYIELSKHENIQWKTVWIKGVCYTINTALVTAYPVQLPSYKAQPQLLMPNNGNVLVAVTLMESVDSKTIPSYIKKDEDTVWLIGVQKRKEIRVASVMKKIQGPLRP